MEELKKKRVERPIEGQKSGKEKAEQEMSEEEKAKQKSKPVSSTAVPGTPWCVVWTRDKRVFFYNPSEKVSLWERPDVLKGRIDVDKMVKEPPAILASDTAHTNLPAKKKTDSVAPEPPTKKSK